MASLTEFVPQSTQTTSRFNLYQSVHKGLRAMLADLLLNVGRSDGHNAEDSARRLAQLQQVLQLCCCHLQHEEQHLHRAMEARAPGSSAERDAEHQQHQAEIDALQQQATALATLPAHAQAAAWQLLYGRLSLFVADNFVHMLQEEQANMAVLWAHYSDAELIELHDVLVAGIAPEEMAHWFRWIVPHIAHSERVAMFAGMRQGMPPEIFAQTLAQAGSLLPTQDWCQLQQALAA